jgi:transcriptional regulator with XRE-family HTH domain
MDIDLGLRLAQLRRERGYTQIELANKVGTTQTVVSDYERGKLRPHPDMLVRLAAAFAVSTDVILGLAPSKKDHAFINRRFFRRLKLVDGLARRDQEALLRTIDAFLSKSA